MHGETMKYLKCVSPLSYKRVVISFDLFAQEPWSLWNSLDVKYGMSCCETFLSTQLFLALFYVFMFKARTTVNMDWILPTCSH